MGDASRHPAGPLSGTDGRLTGSTHTPRSWGAAHCEWCRSACRRAWSTTEGPGGSQKYYWRTPGPTGSESRSVWQNQARSSLGKKDPVPLADVWPGFWPVLAKLKCDFRGVRQDALLVRCERISVGGDDRESILHASSIYLRRSGDGKGELLNVLKLVSPPDEILRAGDWVWDLLLNESVSQLILEYVSPPDVDEQREEVRRQPTDAERLLKAVGESALRQHLPESLLAILEGDGAPVSGVSLAQAAIATHHTGTLRQYRHALGHLDPPRQWAGSSRAVGFVRALGFSAEWAGDRNVRRSPFVEVAGPYSLPALHDYQKTIVAHVRNMLRGGGGRTEQTTSGAATGNALRQERANGGGRRGMVSLPTGSGKARVAVEAIVEAMRDDGFRGGVLWVADREELCEQAVEAWRQVWSSIGAQGARLRISRLWAGQPGPRPTSELHVVVATIQTLGARLLNRRSEYDFLTEFALVVFDEAHRSVAPTFTSVMQEVGLTRRRGKTSRP